MAKAIDEHHQRASANAAERKTGRAMAHIGELVRGLLADRAEAAMASRGGLAELAEQVVKGAIDPYSAAESVVEKL